MIKTKRKAQDLAAVQDGSSQWAYEWRAQAAGQAGCLDKRAAGQGGMAVVRHGFAPTQQSCAEVMSA